MPLNQDEKRIRLKAIADENWQTAAAARIAALPKTRQPLANHLLRLDQDVSLDYQERQAEARRFQDSFVGLTPKQRHQLLAVLHPELGDDLNNLWIHSSASTYQVSSYRRAFRAPSVPAMTEQGRYYQLMSIVASTAPYQRDIAWFAAWGDVIIGRMFAGFIGTAIDHNPEHGDAVFETVTATIRGEHDIAVMHAGAIGALLRASRQDGWTLVEGLLLAAQRQEGLRQSILEQIDEGHPDVFVTMLRVILDNNLLRFAATIRAVGVWVGLHFDVEHEADAKKQVESLLDVLDNKSGYADAIASNDPTRTYSAFVARAMVDAIDAVDEVAQLIPHLSVPCRIAASQFLAAVGLVAGHRVLLELVDDADEVVAYSAFTYFAFSQRNRFEDGWQELDAVAPLLRLADRMPTTLTVPASLFGSTPIEGDRNRVLQAAMLRHTGDMDVFLPYFDEFDSDARVHFASRCQRKESVSSDVRSALLHIVGARGSHAASSAVQALEKLQLEPADAPELEPYLTRKATKLRQGVMTLLSSLPDEARVASAERLWATTNDGQRNAACELIAEVDNETARSIRATWTETATDRQRELLGDAGQAVPEANLYDPDRRTPAVQPSGIKQPNPLVTTAAAKLAGALDDLAEQHKDVQVEISNWQGSDTCLLTDVHYFPYPLRQQEIDDGVERDMLLGDIVREWWEQRPKSMRNTDGCEALRASLLLNTGRRGLGPAEPDDSAVLLGQTIPTLRHHGLVAHWLTWLGNGTMTAALLDQFVTASEFVAQELTAEELTDVPLVSAPYRHRHLDPRLKVTSSRWHSLILSTIGRDPDLATAELVGRLWRLERWIEEPFPDAIRLNHRLAWPLRAFDHGLATDDDVLWVLSQGSSLSHFTRRNRDQSPSPEILAIADRFRSAIIDNELARGEIPMPTSRLVRQVSSVEGADFAMQCVSRLGALSWARGYTWGEDKKATLSHLIRVNYPAPDDTPESLAAAAKQHGIKDKQLVEFGVYAPQWAPMVERVLKWPGFEDAVWWVHSHTKDTGWSVGIDLRETWAAMSAERTPLTAEDLIDGAVDLDWFWRVRSELGPKRWAQVYAAGKYAANGSGHRRAQLFADVVTGSVSQKEITDRIVTKRHQDSVRGLGLLPWPKADSSRQKSQLARYQILREFERGIRKFGSQRQASERTALRIGMENLARNAGYRDPARFGWAMEADELSDLADGPISVVKDDVTITLAVDERGVADLSVDRAGKPLKQIPVKLRKLDDVVDLRERKTQLTKQVSRVRKSLEAAMINADSFTMADIDQLQCHPVVAPMLRTLVFVDRSGKCLRIDGNRFASAAGRAVKASTRGDGELRIAHPVDLLASKKWSEWQAWCFLDGIEQPFKQVFRELYVPTKAEADGLPKSERYAGHQVQPRQAKALFTARAWHTHHDDYSVTKTFHHEGLVARVELDGGFFSPAEVELPVLHALWFTKRGDHKALPISAVPGIMFSEVMRDLDLVVSVAHAGGVDPEASASTVDMRGALVRETATLMKLDNVRHVGNHVVIDGKLGEYSLHLGSGIVHRRPGGQVCVVPVHAQRRGRLFLPFADDDPRTAEVLSKLLLFARDGEIQDPTILSQLHG